MAIKNEDESVTLTAQQFRSCAAHMEMSVSELLTFLTDHEDGFTKEEAVQRIMQLIELHHLPTNIETAN